MMTIREINYTESLNKLQLLPFSLREYVWEHINKNPINVGRNGPFAENRLSEASREN